MRVAARERAREDAVEIAARSVVGAGAGRLARGRVGVDGHHGWKSQDENGQADGAPAQF